MTEEENILIAKAKSGDSSAFETLIYRYDKHVLGIAYNFRYNKEDAKDIYQEVFMRVYRGLKNFEGKSEFSTWLYRIVTNVCISYKRTQKRYEYVSVDQSNDDEENYNSLAERITDETRADHELMNKEIVEKIWQEVDCLPPQQRLAFIYKNMHEYKIREIALMMNCTESAIKKYLFIAVRKLRTKLEDYI